MEIGVLCYRKKEGKERVEYGKTNVEKRPFQEWVSDNLRYMLLILAILVVVGLILLVVHLVSSNFGSGRGRGKCSGHCDAKRLPVSPVRRMDSRAPASRDKSLRRKIMHR